MDRCLILFAKEPEEGYVKTRLAQDIGVKDATKLYKAFLRDSIDLCLRVKCERRLLFHEARQLEPLNIQSMSRGFDLYPQGPGDLGQRMHHAFQQAHELGAQRIIIIGSDSPTLPSAYIQYAFKLLEANDCVLGPSQDGGYYLIGLCYPCRELFHAVSWSTAEVLNKTIQNAEQYNIKLATLNPWYDIDCSNDLERLKDSLSKEIFCGARYTPEALMQLIK